MATWDEVKETLFMAGRDVSQKAKDVSEIAKLKIDIRTKEDFVEKQFAAIGRAYYETHKDDEVIEDGAQFYVIEEALAEIERMKQQILKRQGAAECPKCGAKMPEGATFCSNCGKKMDDIYEEE